MKTFRTNDRVQHERFRPSNVATFERFKTVLKIKTILKRSETLRNGHLTVKNVKRSVAQKRSCCFDLKFSDGIVCKLLEKIQREIPSFEGT